MVITYTYPVNLQDHTMQLDMPEPLQTDGSTHLKVQAVISLCVHNTPLRVNTGGCGNEHVVLRVEQSPLDVSDVDCSNTCATSRTFGKTWI
jgi:hypothetical protein